MVKAEIIHYMEDMLRNPQKNSASAVFNIIQTLLGTALASHCSLVTNTGAQLLVVPHSVLNSFRAQQNADQRILWPVVRTRDEYPPC